MRGVLMKFLIFPEVDSDEKKIINYLKKGSSEDFPKFFETLKRITTEEQVLDIVKKVEPHLKKINARLTDRQHKEYLKIFIGGFHFTKEMVTPRAHDMFRHLINFWEDLKPPRLTELFKEVNEEERRYQIERYLKLGA